MKKFLVPIDMALNQILNAIFGGVASDPSTPVEGQYWYNTATKKVKFYDGSAVKVFATLDDLGGGGDMEAANYDTTNTGNKVDIALLAEAVAWANITGKPSTFAPTAHTHVAADITDLTSVVNGIITSFVDTEAGANDLLDTIGEIVTKIQENADNFADQVKRHQADIGDGSATSIAVTHNLATRDVIVEVYDFATYDTVICDVTRTNTNTVTLDFSVAPASNEFRVVILA